MAARQAHNLKVVVLNFLRIDQRRRDLTQETKLRVALRSCLVQGTLIGVES